MGSPKKTAASIKAAEPEPTPAINFGDGGPEGLRTPTNIHEAIVAVMEQVGYVRKQRGANLNYTYAGEAALIAALRPWMVQYGIYLSVSDIAEVVEQDIPRERGISWRVSLTSRVRFVHSPSATYIDVAARGEAMDVSDKANNKAMTAALKYALRQTFLIETGDDPDDHQPLVARPNAAVAPTAPAAPAAAAPPAEPEPDGAEVDEADIDDADSMNAEIEQAGSGPAEPEEKMPKLANITVSNAKRADYERWWTRLITKFPQYSIQKQGKPTSLLDTSHVRATAATLGYTVISDDNYTKVFEAIAAHAVAKAGNGSGAPAAKAPPAARSSKRPTNDEALKKAGF